MKKEERKKKEEYLKGIVSNLPDSPGCYQYLDENGVITFATDGGMEYEDLVEQIEAIKSK